MDEITSIKQLNSLLTETSKLLDAVNNHDNLEIGRMLNKRKLTLNYISSKGGLNKDLTPEEKDISNKILELDHEFLSKLKETFDKTGDSVEKFTKKNTVFQKYNESFLNFEPTNLMDKKK